MYSIKVENISKAYKSYPTKTSRLKEWLSFNGKERHTKKWVLKDINILVSPGEAIGIVGMNGAGKSTLLKIITGTTSPTTGTVEFNGSVAALLELGMGFHGDFTGRQNVYMAGQLLGLTIPQLDILMPSIEDFAEIGEYIDQPVRVYSSGMQVRLAFSVATAVRPDILIVDEALSVGDAYFQHKSFERIKQFREQGTTLLLVSHDKGAIQAVCDRAILLKHGEIIKEGKPDSVMDFYNALLAERSNEKIEQATDEYGVVKTRSGNFKVQFESIKLADSSDKRIEVLGTGQKAKLAIRVKANDNVNSLVCGFMIKDRLGQAVFGTNSSASENTIYDVKKGEQYLYEYYFDANLGEGNYSISLALHEGDTHVSNNFEWQDLALTFQIINIEKDTFVGNTWLSTELKVGQIHE